MTDNTATTDTSREDLRERNLVFFREQFPGIGKQLENHTPVSALIDEGEGWYNLKFMGELLYAPTAKDYIGKQLESFRERPHRINMMPMQPKSFDRYAANFLHHFIQRASGEGLEFAAHVPVSKNAYYMFVMGFGLGAHIDELVETSRCQALLIIEPNVEFLAQSLEVFDWQALHNKMEERGGYLDLLVSGNQEEVFTRLKHDIRLTNPCSFDGSLIFVNYHNEVFEVVNQRLYRDLSLILSGLGFYFDETVMLTNTHENLSSGDASMIRFQTGKIKSYPAFVCASGPSLDKDIEWIKNNQDKAVIFACGTAILPLKRNGIEPDFQVEIENIPELYEENVIQKKYIDFSNTHLLATTTVDPRVPTLYGRTSYYFRPALSSFPMFARPDDEPMHNGSPTVTNAAMALAMLFGFREFYLFGADMGSKVEGLAHSKHAWQNTDEGCEVDIKFDIPVRGNFGGTVYSYADLNWTRDELENAIKSFHKGRQYFNCSDGAYIKGTLAKHSKSIKLKDQPYKKSFEVKKLVDTFAPYPLDDFEKMWDDATVRDEINDYCDRLLACFEDIEDVKSKRALTRANKQLSCYNVFGHELGISMLFRGTVWQAFMAVDYYINRVDGEEDSQRAAEIFKEDIERLINHLRKIALEDIGHLSEQEWAPRERILEFEVEDWD